METLKERIDNLEMFLSELAYGDMPITEAQSQADYHIATIDLLKRTEPLRYNEIFHSNGLPL